MKAAGGDREGREPVLSGVGRGGEDGGDDCGDDADTDTEAVLIVCLLFGINAS